MLNADSCDRGVADARRDCRRSPLLIARTSGMLTDKHMPRGPKGQKRPADVIGNAVHVMRIATGEIDETLTEDGKNQAAVQLGRKGGKARAQRLSKKRRSTIAKAAALARWSAKGR